MRSHVSSSYTVFDSQAQWIEVPDAKAEFNSWVLGGGRRELISTSCLLTSTSVTHTHMHAWVRVPINKYINKWKAIIKLAFLIFSQPLAAVKVNLKKTYWLRPLSLDFKKNIKLLFLFYFLSMDVLSTCMSVYHLHALYPQRPKEAIRAPETGIIYGYEIPCGYWE